MPKRNWLEVILTGKGSENKNPNKNLEASIKILISDVRTLALEVRKLGEKMSVELDALRAEVEENTAVDQSAITLLQGLAAKIEELKTDPAALQELADKLNASSDALAAAVAANTPAA